MGKEHRRGAGALLRAVMSREVSAWFKVIRAGWRRNAGPSDSTVNFLEIRYGFVYYGDAAL